MEKLMEVIFERNNLNIAYKKVKSNKGASGVDGMTINEALDYLKANSNQLIQSIMEGSYQPQPVKRVEIPKDNGKTRKLGIPTVIDRIIQQAIVNVLTEIYEPDFNDNSYGFRPGRSSHDAIDKSIEYLNDDKTFIVDIDLEKYFDTINQDKLMYLLTKKIGDKRLLKLINKIMYSGVLENGTVIRSKVGVPQGGPLSPLLSNIYLNELDKELTKRGLSFVRYADDIQIFVKSQKAGERVLKSISKYLDTKLKLKVNKEKSSVKKYHDSSFLGFGFFKYKGIYYPTISRKSLQKFKEKVRVVTKRNRGRNIKSVIYELNKISVGWVNYFSIAKCKSAMRDLDGWIRRKIRCYIYKQWKKIKTRFNNLKKLGVEEPKAWEFANTRKGLWRISHSPILATTLTNAYIGKLGFKSLSNTYAKISY